MDATAKEFQLLEKLLLSVHRDEAMAKDDEDTSVKANGSLGRGGRAEPLQIRSQIHTSSIEGT